MTDDELVAGYLRRLKRASRTLPRPVRRELMQEIAGHIAEARAAGGEPGGDGSAALRTVLEQLGDPRDIARAAAGARAGRPGGLEITAVVLLLVGGLLGLAVGNLGFGAGLVGAIAVWLTGAVMLWASPRWQLSDKILGSLVWPGGLALPFLLASPGLQQRLRGHHQLHRLGPAALAGHTARGRPRRRATGGRHLAGAPGPATGSAGSSSPRTRRPLATAPSVEDRSPGPAALQLEEAVGAGDQQDAVPELPGRLAARDGRHHRPEDRRAIHRDHRGADALPDQVHARVVGHPHRFVVFAAVHRVRERSRQAHLGQ